MSLFSFFRSPKKPSAVEAKERLQIVLAHERLDQARPDYLQRMHKDILQVIAKYVPIAEDKISVQFENTGSVSLLEVNIELPNAGLGLVRRTAS